MKNEINFIHSANAKKLFYIKLQHKRSPEGTVQSGPYLLISEFYSYASEVLCMPLQ